MTKKGAGGVGIRGGDLKTPPNTRKEKRAFKKRGKA